MSYAGTLRWPYLELTAYGPQLLREDDRHHFFNFHPMSAGVSTHEAVKPNRLWRLVVLVGALALVGLLCLVSLVFTRDPVEPARNGNSESARQPLPTERSPAKVGLATNTLARAAAAREASSTPPTQSDRDQLLRILEDRSAKPEERAVAADKLGKDREAEAADALLHVVQDGSEADILRYKAARALGVLKDERAVPVLSAILRNQSADRHLRVISALALGNLGTEDSFQALRAVANDPESLIRYKALQALERAPNKSNRETVKKALSDPDPYVQARAIHTLGKLGDKATVGTLDQILRSTQSDFIKIACLTALGNIKEAESVALLRQYEGNTNQLLSLNARTALRRLNPTERNQP